MMTMKFMQIVLNSTREAITAWFDAERVQINDDARRVDWMRITPFILIHMVAVIGMVVTGFSWFALFFAMAMYVLRMFAITAFYHRYFSHRAFKTSRVAQFVFAVLGATATQRGPLWWAAHHRHHHRSADTVNDPHAPLHGFYWSHMGWFLSRRHFRTDFDAIPDLAAYPELRWLDRYALFVPVVFATAIYLFGHYLALAYPGLGASGGQLLFWGYFASTVVLTHATLTINSLAHRWGKRRYATRDDSRNNWLLALLTLGEGWHNNHHHFPGSARQGFFWWEIDISYYLLRLLALLGIVSELRNVPEAVRNARLLER